MRAFSKCCHRKRFVAGKFKSMHAWPSRQQLCQITYASKLQGLLTDLSHDEQGRREGRAGGGATFPRPPT